MAQIIPPGINFIVTCVSAILFVSGFVRSHDLPRAIIADADPANEKSLVLWDPVLKRYWSDHGNLEPKLIAITNLDDFISPFILRHCIIILDTPKSVRYHSLIRNPTLVRSLVLLLFRRQEDPPKLSFRLTGPDNFAQRNETYLREVLPCPISKFLTGLRIATMDVCLMRGCAACIYF